LNLSTYANGVRNVWTDFDYAAYFDLRSAVAGLRFHGTGNSVGAAGDCILPNPSPTNPFVLGNPAYRFGFDCTTMLSGGVQVPTATYGQPREYVTTSAPATFFIGRFTQAETSDPTFGYPGNQNGASGNPMDSTTVLTYNTTTGAVSTIRVAQMPT
jgi:hypothetical protein